MNTKQALAIFSLLTICALAMMPLSTLGVFYAVITTCVLLGMVPVSVEAVMAIHSEEGYRR